MRPRRGRAPRGDPGSRDRHRDRQHRDAVQRAEPALHQLDADRSRATPTSWSRCTEDHAPTAEYVRRLRLELPKRFPGVLFTFIPADIVSQTLNFGLPAPIDIQVIGRNLEANRGFASALMTRLANVPGLTDLRVHQAFNQPQLHFVSDRTLAAQSGFTQRELASNLLISLSGSGQTTPTFWLNPTTGVQYAVATQTPQYQITSLQGLGAIQVTGASGARPQLLDALDGHSAGRGHGGRVALQRAADDRHLRRGAGPRPRRRVARHRAHPRRGAREAAARLPVDGARPDRDDADVVLRPAGRAWPSRSSWSTC